jgi:hypothetical protein
MKRTKRAKHVKTARLLEDRKLSAAAGGSGEPGSKRLGDAPSIVVTDYSPDSDR